MASSGLRTAHSGGITRVMLVAWREFRYTALTKAFLIGAVGVPIGMFGLMLLLPMMMSGKAAAIEGKIVVVSSAAELIPAADTALDEQDGMSFLGNRADREGKAAPLPGGTVAAVAGAASESADFHVEFELASPGEDIEALKEQVRQGTLLAVAQIPDSLLSAQRTEPAEAGFLYVSSSASPKHTVIFSRALRDAVLQVRIRRSGANHEQLAALMARPDLESVRLAEDGGEAHEDFGTRLMIPMGFMMLIWIATFASANQLLTTTIEEKSSKVMEVLLSALSPLELLGGKILGQAAVAGVMLLLYGAAGLGGLASLAMMDLITPLTVVLLLIYGTMAYFMVAALMAAVGSAVSDLREAQSLVGPAMMIVMVPLILWLPISENPNGVLAVICSFIPPAMPFVMVLRTAAAAEPVPGWQIAATIVWGGFATVAMIWLAARIFRVGVLMQGKPPTPAQLLRWARQG